MRRLDFVKANGEVADMASVHRWLDIAVKHIMNGSYVLAITKVVRKRSLNQNRLMWMWFKCLELDTGQSSQDFHDYYCKMFLSRDIVHPITGELERVSGGTSNLNTAQMTEFLDKVQADAATEFGITLPTPDDLGYEDFEEQFKNLV